MGSQSVGHTEWLSFFHNNLYLFLIEQSSISINLCQIFPDSSVGKESACSEGDPGLIPGLGRSAGEGISYLLQYSWVSLMAQLVNNPSAMWETWAQSLGWEDPLKKGKGIHPSIQAWRIPWTVYSMGLHRVRHDWATFTFTYYDTMKYKKENRCDLTGI